MLAKRIIPCLDVRAGRVVKGVNFDGIQDVEDPVTLARYYNENGADELVFYDITASYENRGIFTDILTRVASEIYIPLTVGGGISSLGGNFTLYNTFVARTDGSAWEIAYIVLAYAALPAFCEELVYRSILCAEYEKLGTGVSVLVSALFFSMLHFSFPFFVNYLVLGILLAFVMYTTRSALAPMLLHFFYNIFCLFGQPYLSAFYVNAGSNEIFLFCLIVLLLLFSAFSAGEARKIYHLYARANVSSDYTTSVSPSEYPKRILTALKTPIVIPVFLLWFIMAIIDLFV